MMNTVSKVGQTAVRKLSTKAKVAEEMQRFKEIFKANKQWVEYKTRENPNFFKELASLPQQPRYLFIGCSDSRVPANNITGLRAGELFVHRNIANLVVHTDLNLLSVLQYAVEYLKVKHIIVCGHYGCGGVKAAMEHTDTGLLDNWLRNIRDVQRLHKDTMDKIEDPEQRYRKLVELNVVEQCLNLFKTGIVQRSIRKTKFPRLHGLVYELEDGILNELEIDFPAYSRKYNGIYSLYPNEPDQNENKE